MNQARNQPPNRIRVAEPLHKIGTCISIAARKVAGLSVHGAPGKLTKSRGVEKSPVFERWELSPDFFPIRHVFVCSAARVFTAAAASATGTSLDFFPWRSTIST